MIMISMRRLPIKDYVQSGDNLPALVCDKCILLLNLSHKFIQNAHDTEKNLKTFLTKISNDFKLVTKSATEAIENESSVEIDEMLNLIGAAETVLPTEKQKQTSNEQFYKHSKASQIIEDTENADETTLAEPDEDGANMKKETSLVSNDNDENSSENKPLPSITNDFENLIDLQRAADITKDDNHFMDLNTILVTDDDTVQFDEDSINDQHLKGVTYNEEYEALLEDDSTSMDIILYEDDESTVYQATDTDCKIDGKTTKENDEATCIIVLDGPKCDEDKDADTNAIAEDESMFTDSKTIEKSPVKESSSKKTAENSFTVESKRFYCTKCKRDFSTKTNLTRHLALHDGKRPFQCEICFKGFSQNGTLKQHMYIHTGEKPYVCPVCKRGFTQSKSLVFHMRRHSGEKPHQCDYCFLLFRQKDALKVHILKHHMFANERVFSCKICNKEMGVQALRNHMKSHVNNHKFADTSSDIMEMIDETDLLNDSVLMSNEVSLKFDGSTHVIDVMATSTTEPSRAKKYQCRKCFKCFAIKKNFIRHLSFHDIHSTDLQHCETDQLTFNTEELN